MHTNLMKTRWKSVENLLNLINSLDEATALEVSSQALHAALQFHKPPRAISASHHYEL